MTFGVPPFESGMKMEIGTELELLEVVNKYPDGKMDISTKARRRFLINEFQLKTDSTLYPMGQVTYFEDDEESILDNSLKVEVQGYVNELLAILNIAIGVEILRDFQNVFQIAHKIGLTFKQEIEILKLDSEYNRLHYILEHLKNFLPIVRQMNEMKTKIRLNGHFKNPPLPDLENDL